MTKQLLSQFIALVLFASLFSSCNLFEKDDEPEIIDEYIVDYELKAVYEKWLIDIAINELKNKFPEVAELSDHLKYGIKIYEIVYNTTFEGEEIQASGLVCIPDGIGMFPIMSFQNGTYFLHSNAPTVNPDRELYRMLELVSSAGFIISIPDYLGFGASDNMFHPYLDKESTVQSVLDMLRAIEELNTNYLDIETNNELYIAGYSMGGWATLQVQKAIEEQFSGEFNLVASASGAGPYDLMFVNEYIINQTTYETPYFVGYIYNSYFNLGLITTPASDVFQEPYATKIPTLYNGNMSEDEINGELTTTVTELFTADYLANYKTETKYASVISSLTANSIEAWNTPTPTLLLHGTDDEFVPFEVSYNINQEFISVGAGDVTFVPLPEYGHTGGILPAGLAMIKWFLDMQE